MNSSRSSVLVVATVLVALSGCSTSSGKAGGNSGAGGSAAGGAVWPSGGASGSPSGASDASALDGGAARLDGRAADAPVSLGGEAAGGMTGAGGSTSGTHPADASAGSPDARAYDGTASPGVDAYLTCPVVIVAADRPNLSGLPPGENSTLTVKGTIVASAPPSTLSWQWTVKGPDGTTLPTDKVASSERSTTSIRFKLLSPGTYDISVSVTSPTDPAFSCKGHAPATVVKQPSQTFFFRVLPPTEANSREICDKQAANYWCPSRDATPLEDSFVIRGGTPGQVDVDLAAGDWVSIDPREQSHSAGFPPIAIPSYIRVAPHGSTWTIDGASTSDHGMDALLDLQFPYDFLIIPDTPSPADSTKKALPPFLVSKRRGEFDPEDFNVPMGVTVQGTLRTATGVAVGARMLLRADASDPGILPLPSTPGVSDTKGAYSLRASKNALFSAVLTPPPGTSLPQVVVANCIDLRSVGDGATLTNVDFTWNPTSVTDLILRIVMSDHSTPSRPIAVRLQSQDGALPEPGVLSVDGTLADLTSGSVQRDGSTDASGTITFAGIPKVAYHIVLVPPSDLAGAAISTGNIDLGGAGVSDTRTMSLANKVTLKGILSPASSAAGALLVATDIGTDVLPNVISTPVNSDGSYTFLADPGRTYRFWIEPAAGKNLPMRIPLYGVQTTDQDTNLAPRTLPSGLKVSGTVTYFDNNLRLPVGGAIVQAYCQQSGIPGCRDPDNPAPTLPPPVVEVTTTSLGTYSFYLPDPGSPG